MFTFELSFKAGDELISFDEDVEVTGGFFGGSGEGVNMDEGVFLEFLLYIVQLCLELLVGQDTGVLELTETVVGDEGKVTIGNDVAQGFLAGVGDKTMFPEMDAEEIIDAVVDGDAVEVVNLVVKGDTFTGPGKKDGMRDEDTYYFEEKWA